MKWKIQFSLIILIGCTISSLAFSSTFAVSGLETNDTPSIDFPVNIDTPFGTCHAGYSLSDLEYNLLKSMGNQWMRIDFPWSNIEPVHGQWDFSYYDAYLTTAANHGQKIIAILDYDNNWLNTSGEYKETRPYIKPEYIPYFLEYVNRTVTRYKDSVAIFEIWNEPNIDNFWKGTDAEFFQLFNASAELIHAIDPSIVIGGAVLAGHDPKYLTKMFEAGIMSKIDVISFHPYSSNVDDIYTKSLEVRSVGDIFGFTGEYLITEVGNPTGGNYSHRVDPYELSNRVIKTLTYATITDIRTIIWYCLFDAGDDTKLADPTNSEWYFGLTYPNYTVKPGAHAFSVFSNLTSHSQYRPDLCLRSSSLYQNTLHSYLYRRTNGESALILWFSDTRLGIQSLDVEISIDELDSAVILHDIYTGDTELETNEPNFHLILGSDPIVVSFTTKQAESVIQVLTRSPSSFAVFIYGLPIAIIGVIMLQMLLRRKKPQ